MHFTHSMKLSSQLVAVVLFGASLFRCQRGWNSAGGGAAAVRAALHSARRESGAAAAESRTTLLCVFSACVVNANKQTNKQKLYPPPYILHGTKFPAAKYGLHCCFDLIWIGRTLIHEFQRIHL